MLECIATSTQPIFDQITTQAELLRAGISATAWSPPSRNPLNLSADFAAIETRLYANLGLTPDALRGDVHRALGTTLGQERGRAKMLNFGLVYGNTPRGRTRHMVHMDQRLWLPRQPETYIVGFIPPGHNVSILDSLAQAPLQQSRMFMNERDWADIVGFTHGSEVGPLEYERELQRQQARNEVMAAEDAEIFRALDAAALRTPRVFHQNWAAALPTPSNYQNWAAEYMGLFSPPPEDDVRGVAVINPRVNRLQTNPPFVTVPDIPPTVQLRHEDIVARRYRLGPRLNGSWLPGGVNPCGEMDLGTYSHLAEMDLPQMEKIAVRIRPTAWQRLLKDDDPF
jgi:hypothetical protein